MIAKKKARMVEKCVFLNWETFTKSKVLLSISHFQLMEFLPPNMVTGQQVKSERKGSKERQRERAFGVGRWKG